MGIVFYTVYYQALTSGSLRMTWGNVTTTSVTVTNLLPATQYRITVVAQNGGTGDEGNRSVSITVTTQSSSSSMSVNSNMSISYANFDRLLIIMLLCHHVI